MKIDSHLHDSVFIISEKAQNLEVLEKILKKEGYCVKSAQNTRKVIQDIENNVPNLIILDFSGNETGYFETCEKLKNRQNTKNIPIIVISASTSAQFKAAAFKAGAVDYITKPFHAIEIIVRVKNQLELYKAKRILNSEIESKTNLLNETIEHLRLKEKRLRTTQRMAQLGNWEWDITTGDVNWSEEVYRIFRLQPSEFVPQIDSILELSPWPEDHARDKELIQKAIDSKEQGSYEQRFLRPDGSIGYYFSTFQGIYDEEDNLIEMQGVVQDITERKLAESALKKSEIKYRRLVESLKNEYFFYSHNPEGVFTYISPSIKNILGYEVSESLAHFSVYMTESEINMKASEYTGMSIKGIEQEPYEVEVYYKNGGICTLEVKEVPVVDEKGVVIAVEGIARDITEKKTAREKLKLSEERYRMLFENMNEGFALHEMIFDSKGAPYDYRYLDLNPSFTKLTGLSKNTAVGKTIRELIPETVNDPADWINRFGNVVIKENDVVIEDYSVALKKWFKVHVFKVQKNQFAVTVSDISSKIRNEQRIKNLNESLENKVDERTKELSKINKLLKEEKDRAQMYLDVADVIILTLDLDQNVTMINKKGCNVFGYTESEMIGKNWYKHFRDKAGKKEGIKEFAKVVHKKNREIIRNENYIVTKSGERRLIAWSDINIQDKNGAPVGMLSSGEDITERKELENHLIKAKIEANEANKAKSDFLANMSHEIRTPMNSILGFTELLSNLINDRVQLNYLASIKSSGQSLMALINDILDLSKIEAGKLEIQYNYINLYTVFQDVSSFFSLNAAEKGIEFILNIDSTVQPVVIIDDVRLRQIMTNLLSNAIKFTKRGYVKLSASSTGIVNKSDKNKYCNLIIEVEDSGIGITKKAHNKIFEPFIQQDGQSVKRYGGTGLGLAITKTLVELMNGTISLESVEGKGSCFKVIFYEVKVAKETTKLKSTSVTNPKSIDFTGSKILVVDDIDNNKEYLSLALSNYNLQVHEASDGIEALNIIKIDPPDLIITDLWMPDLDGIELKKRLQNDPKLKEIPIIGISASVMKETLKKVEENNFSGFLKKPFKIGELLSEMIKHIPYKLLKKNNEEMNQAEMISRIKIDNIDSFLNEINALSKLHQPLITRQPIKEVKNFADKCLAIAKKFNIQVLENYGSSLHSAASNFDIDALLKYVDSYKPLVNKIIERIRK